MQAQNLIQLVLLLSDPILPQGLILVKPLQHLVTLNANSFVVVVSLLQLLVEFFHDGLFLGQFLLQHQNSALVVPRLFATFDLRALPDERGMLELGESLLPVVGERGCQPATQRCGLRTMFSLPLGNAVQLCDERQVHLDGVVVVGEVTDRV